MHGGRLSRRPGTWGLCPRSCPFDYDRPVVYDLTVYDETPEYVDTGLLSPDGEPILRLARDPIGFLWSELPEDQPENPS